MEQHISILMYEPSQEVKKKWREVLIACAVSHNCEIKIDWLKNGSAVSSISNAAVGKNMAFVNTDDEPKAIGIGELIYSANPECELVYYGVPNSESIESLTDYFCKLFPSRPIRFFEGHNVSELVDVVKSFSERSSEDTLFCWETKSIKYRVPQKNILYFRSDRNYVCIKLLNGEELSFIAKLTDVEKRLQSNTFIRLHQSYLVNKSQIIYFDKSKKSAKLTNGEVIYISKAHYKDALSI